MEMRAQNKKIFKRVLLATAMVVVYLLFIVCRDKSVYHYKRGTALGKKGEHDQAILCFDKALEINPRFVEAYCNRGVTYDKKGEYNRAISDFNKALEINPWFTVAYYNRGNAYGAQGEYNRAILDYTKAIEIDPKYAMAYYNRATVYCGKREYDKAWEDVHKAQSLRLQVHPGFLKTLREASGREK
jgi:tetratricopeptide (TPR) repeat protein